MKHSAEPQVHATSIRWQRTSDDFSYDSYAREHEWLTGSGQRVQGSAAPAFLGSGDAMDPEEAFVGAVAACHMLSFLAICARRRLVVDSYRDDAQGYLEKNNRGKLALTRIELRPAITFANGQPDSDRLTWLHKRAHDECFIANSVRTAITVHDPVVR